MIVSKLNNRSAIYKIEEKWNISLFISLQLNLMSLFIELTQSLPMIELYIKKTEDNILIINTKKVLFQEFLIIEDIILDGLRRKIDVQYEAIRLKKEKIFRYHIARTLMRLKAKIILKDGQVKIFIPLHMRNFRELT